MVTAHPSSLATEFLNEAQQDKLSIITFDPYLPNPWHKDFFSLYAWMMVPFHTIEPYNRQDPTEEVNNEYFVPIPPGPQFFFLLF